MRFSAFDFDVVTSPAPDDPEGPAMTETAAPLHVLSTLGLMGALQARQAALEAALGRALAIEFAPTKVLIDRLAEGAPADLAILTAEAVAELTESGRLAPGGVGLAASRVGMAQAPGQARPDISTPAALIATLRGARSIAYSGAGASGLYFAALIARLGIAAEVNAKATVIPSGLTGALVARGTCEYAIQQISELRLVAGIDIIGPLPAEVQTPTVFSVAAVAGAADPAAAARLIALLRGAEMAAALAESGLEPMA